jgi:hypothetical protein
LGTHVFDRVKKTASILLAIFFVVSLTAAAASAQPNVRGPSGHPNIRWEGRTMWDDEHHWNWDGQNWHDNDHNFRWDGHDWWDDEHHWRWDGSRWWNGNQRWDGSSWRS